MRERRRKYLLRTASPQVIHYERIKIRSDLYALKSRIFKSGNVTSFCYDGDFGDVREFVDRDGTNI